METPFARASQATSEPSIPLDDVYTAVLDAAQPQFVSDADAQAGRLQASLPAWRVQLHNTRSPDAPRKPFTPLVLHNTFFTAMRTLGTARETLIIDFNFRHHFELPGIASAAYTAALAEVPDVFVGHKSQLEALVTDVYQLMLREYKAKGMSLPPWRTLQALLSLWSNGIVRPAAAAAPGLQRSASEGRNATAAAAVVATRANSAPPAKVMMGFDVNPEYASPVSALVFRPSFGGSSVSSMDEDAPATLFGTASSGFSSPIGSSGNASPLSSSVEMDKPALLGSIAASVKLW